jgi:hypothetical protein
MNLWAAKKIKYGKCAWVTSVPNLLVFYSISFYSVYITDTNIISLDKPSRLADSLKTWAETPIVLY